MGHTTVWKVVVPVCVVLLALAQLAAVAVGTTYYVSTTGNDGNDGLSPSTAWATIDKGDRDSILNPGDTVIIGAGTYLLNSDLVLKNRGGTATDPITYKADGEVIVQLLLGSSVIEISGLMAGNAAEHIVLDGLHTKGGYFGILVNGSDGNEIKNCQVSDKLGGGGVIAGVRITGGTTNLLFHHNIVGPGLSTGHGIDDRDGTGDMFYNNIITDNINEKALLAGDMSVVKNNIIYNVGVCFNDWVMNSDHDYNVFYGYKGLFEGGAVLGPNETTDVDPLFVDPANRDFHLQLSSPAREAGIDVGMPFVGLAPDIGVYDEGRIFYVSTTGSDSNDGLTPGAAWATIDKGDRDAILNAGDRVLIEAGTYSPSAGVVLANQAGTAPNPIIYQAEGDVIVNRSLTPGAAAVEVDGPAGYLVLDGLQMKGGEYGLVVNNSVGNEVKNCRISDKVGASASAAGVSVKGASGDLLFHNNIVGPSLGTTSQGIDDSLASGGGDKYYNNVIVGATDWAFRAGTAAEFRNNIVYTGVNGLSGASTHTNNILNGLGGTLYSGTSADPSESTADPLFVDAGNRDYRTQDGSPAIDAGVDVGLPFVGVAPDIGWYENPAAAFGNVTGVVKDSGTGDPIAGAAVSSGSVSTTTNGSGVYLLEQVPIGTQSVMVVAAGHSSMTKSTTVVGMSTVTLDFDLSSLPFNTYYVSLTGNNANDGLTPGTAWRDVDYGDGSNTLIPGDTVLILAGTYTYDRQIPIHNRGGTPTDPITYRGVGEVIIDRGLTVADRGFDVYGSNGGVSTNDHSDYLLLDNLQFRGGVETLRFDGAMGIEVKNCRISDKLGGGGTTAGVVLSGDCSNFLFHNNIVGPALYQTTAYKIGHAIENRGSWGTNKRFYNNVITDATDWSILGNNAEVHFKNNILHSAANGIFGPIDHDYNIFYQVNANLTTDGPLKPHEYVVNPMFVDPSSRDYHVENLSPAIDAGLDVGLPFNDFGPDIGAYEAPSLGTLVDIANVSDVGSQADGTFLRITTPVGATVSSATFGDGSYYVEELDRSAGLKAVGGATAIGDRVVIAGVLGTVASGEKVLMPARVTSKTAGSPLGPLAMNNKTVGGGGGGFQPGITGATGPNNIGLLVTVYGRVSSPGTNDFILDDGSGVNLKVVMPSGQAIPAADLWVTVTGISSCEENGGTVSRLIKSIGPVHVAPGPAGLAASTFGGGQQVWMRGGNFVSRSMDGGVLNFVADPVSAFGAISGIAYNFPDPAGQPTGTQKDWWAQYEIPQASVSFPLDGGDPVNGKIWTFWARTTQSVQSGSEANWVIVNGDPNDLSISNPSDAQWLGGLQLNFGQEAILNNVAGSGLVGYKFGWFSQNPGVLVHKVFKVIDGKTAFRIYEREAGPPNALIDVICWSDNDTYVPTDDDLLSLTGW
ncbi:MAG: carboxypeptidase regulatory-like domain-containing protein [Armatimonadetes bacterium]|nr:carboxypeptidase regulatory-like domain-containing protein [Armatimonadota bacterium]